MHSSVSIYVNAACGRAEQCHRVPSPLVGEGQGEGFNTNCLRFIPVIRQMQPAVVLELVYEPRARCFVATPLPVPPPQGGRDREARTFAAHATCVRADLQ